MVFLIYLIVPLLIAVGCWIFSSRITWKEFGLQLLIQILVIGAFVLFLSLHNNIDTEIWNGQVVKKYSQKVSCKHSYPCNCRLVCHGSGKDRFCSTVCDTCYRHSYDMEWVIDTTIGDFHIATIDEQGLRMPPRWDVVKVSEPVSDSHLYMNYIKGNPSSLFNKKQLVKDFKDVLPEYPSKQYDYYKVDRVVSVGVPIPNIAEWNKRLFEINGRLGVAKQVNIVLVVTKRGQEYYQAVEQFWLGGKKNDAIPVIGVDGSGNVQWVDVMSFSNEEFKIKLRNELLGVSNIFSDTDKLFTTIENVVQASFIRREMKEFEYLNASAQPTPIQWIIGFILSLALAVGLSIWFHKSDVFNDE